MFEVGELGAGRIDPSVTFEDGSFVRALLHAGTGALGGLIMGDLRGALGGALGAGLSELIVPNIGPSLNLTQDGERTLSQLIGGLGSLVAGDGSMSGATSALNGFEYNRMLHPSETARIRELAGSDDERRARLQAAACFLVRCADGIPESDPSYATLRALQSSGAQFAEEQALLASQTRTVTLPGGSTDFGTYPETDVSVPLFNYNAAERLADFCSSGATCTRVAGGVMVAGGAATLASGFGTCVQSAGAGCAVAIVVGADLTSAGTIQMITGRDVVPAGEQVLRSFGLTETQAALLYGSFGVLPGLTASERVAVQAARESIAVVEGRVCVYTCVIDGQTRYVGITEDIARRGYEHMRTRGLEIEQIAGLENLSRLDARAVEQTLINYYGLGRDGGELLNRINSISATRNPTAYEQSLVRGRQLLDSVNYQWTR